MIRFSIILPVYNVEKYIKRCIISIIRQNFRDFELIIIDDESKDKSIEIATEVLREFHGNYRIIRQKNKGLGGARNTGIKAAKGQYLVFIDSDDYIEINYLNVIDQKISESGAEILLFDSIMVSEKGGVLGDIVFTGLKETIFDLSQHKSLLLLSNAAWNKVYLRQLFEENDIMYPEALLYEDLATTGKLLLASKSIVYVKEKLYNYVKRKNSITTSTNFSRHHEIVQAFNILEQYFVEQNVQREYQQELEFLAVSNLLLSHVTFINHYDYKEKTQYQLISFICNKYPNFWRNIYIRMLSYKQKIILWLIINKKLKVLNYCITNSNFKKFALFVKELHILKKCRFF